MLPDTPTTYQDFVIIVLNIIQLMVAALFAIAFIYFIWKMIDSWVLNAGEETKRMEGKKYAVAAVIAFVVMVSTWGIVAMLKNSIFG